MSNYLWGVASKKIAWGIAKGILTVLSYAKSQAILTRFGVHIDLPTFQAAAGAVALGILEGIHDWLRVHFPSVKWI